MKKLAGEFQHLGDAYPGDDEFDTPPRKGVVKLFYPANGAGKAGEGGAYSHCGFFKCPWWRWGAFKEAATRKQPGRAATGIYPIATIVPVPERAKAGPAVDASRPASAS